MLLFNALAFPPTSGESLPSPPPTSPASKISSLMSEDEFSSGDILVGGKFQSSLGLQYCTDLRSYKASSVRRKPGRTSVHEQERMAVVCEIHSKERPLHTIKKLNLLEERKSCSSE